MSDIEWGEWILFNNWADVPEEYQMQRINGVVEYRARKPPTPVVQQVTCLGDVDKDGATKEYGVWHTHRAAGSRFALSIQLCDGKVDTSVPPIARWVKT
jgi:hypothetical protein